MVNGPQNWFDRRWPTYTKNAYRPSPDPMKNRPGYLVDRRYGMGAVPVSPVVESVPRLDQPASALRTSNISSANLFPNPPSQMPPRSTQVLFPPKPDYELDSFKKDWSPRPAEIAWGADAENTYPLTGRHGHKPPALSPVNEPRTAPPKRVLKDTTTRLESRRTLRDDAPNTIASPTEWMGGRLVPADKTQPSLALRQKETKEEMRPYMDLDDPFSPVFNALEIPGSSVRGLIKAYNNYNTKAYEHGGEDLLLPDIPGQIRNGPNDPSFVDAQQIARPGAGLAELTAIRALTDPLFLDSIPAIGKAAYGAVKAAPGAVKSAYGAARAAPGAVTDAYNTAAPFFRAATGAVGDAYKAAAPYVKAAPGAVNDAANAIMFAPDRIADAVGGAYKSAAGSVGGAYNSAAGAVADAARGAYNQPFMRSAAGAAGDAARASYGAARSTAGAVGDAYKSTAGAVGDAYKSTAGAVGDAAKRTADTARGLFSTNKATINPLGIDPATYARRTNPSITPDPRYADGEDWWQRNSQRLGNYKVGPEAIDLPQSVADQRFASMSEKELLALWWRSDVAGDKNLVESINDFRFSHNYSKMEKKWTPVTPRPNVQSAAEIADASGRFAQRGLPVDLPAGKDLPPAMQEPVGLTDEITPLDRYKRGEINERELLRQLDDLDPVGLTDEITPLAGQSYNEARARGPINTYPDPPPFKRTRPGYAEPQRYRYKEFLSERDLHELARIKSAGGKPFNRETGIGNRYKDRDIADWRNMRPGRKLPEPSNDWTPRPEGTIRIAHISSNPSVPEKIRRTGLDYTKQGLISGTTRIVDNKADLVAINADPRFANGTANIFDVPFDEYEKHNQVIKRPTSRTAPGRLHPKYLTSQIVYEGGSPVYPGTVGRQLSLFDPNEVLRTAKNRDPLEWPDIRTPLAGQKRLFDPNEVAPQVKATPQGELPVDLPAKRDSLINLGAGKPQFPTQKPNLIVRNQPKQMRFNQPAPLAQVVPPAELPLSQNIVPAKRDSLINLGAGKPNLIVRNQPKQMRFNQPAPQAEVAAVEVAKAVETKKPPRKRNIKVPAAVPAETPQLQTPAGQQRNLFDTNEVVPAALQGELPVGQPAPKARVAPAKRKQAKVPAAVPAETPQVQPVTPQVQQRNLFDTNEVVPAALQGELPVNQPAKRASLQYPEPPNTTGKTPSQLKEAYIKAVERGIETPEGRNLEAEAYKNAYRATPEGQKARSERILEKTIEGRAETIDRERFADRYSGLGTVTSPEMKQLPSGDIVDSGGRKIPKQASVATDPVATDPVATEAYAPPRGLAPAKRKSLLNKLKAEVASFPPTTQSQGRQFNPSEVWTGTQPQQDAVIKKLDSRRVPAREQIPGTASFQTGRQPAKQTIAERMRPLDDLKWPLAKKAPTPRARSAQPDVDALNRLIKSAEGETNPEDLLKYMQQSRNRSGGLASKSALGEVAPSVTVGEDGFNQYVAELTGTNDYIRMNNAMVSAISELAARKGEDAVPANVMQTLQNMRREVGRTGSDKRLGEFNSVASGYGVRVNTKKVDAVVHELPTIIERKRINVGATEDYSAMSSTELSTKFTDFLRSNKNFDKAKDLFRAANREQREALYGLVPQGKRHKVFEAELRAIHKELNAEVARLAATPSTAQKAAQDIVGAAPPKVGNTHPVPTKAEEARWGAVDAYTTPIIESLSDDALDAVGARAEVSRAGLGDAAYRKKILESVHPDDLLDAIPSAQPSTAQKAAREIASGTPIPAAPESALPTVKGEVARLAAKPSTAQKAAREIASGPSSSTMEKLHSKLDDMSINDTKKSAVIKEATKAYKDGLIDENALNEIKRISKDKDMATEDVIEELKRSLDLGTHDREQIAEAYALTYKWIREKIVAGDKYTAAPYSSERGRPPRLGEVGRNPDRIAGSKLSEDQLSAWADVDYFLRKEIGLLNAGQLESIANKFEIDRGLSDLGGFRKKIMARLHPDDILDEIESIFKPSTAKPRTAPLRRAEIPAADPKPTTSTASTAQQAAQEIAKPQRTPAVEAADRLVSYMFDEIPSSEVAEFRSMFNRLDSESKKEVVKELSRRGLISPNAARKPLMFAGEVHNHVRKNFNKHKEAYEQKLNSDRTLSRIDSPFSDEESYKRMVNPTTPRTAPPKRGK